MRKFSTLGLCLLLCCTAAPAAAKDSRITPADNKIVVYLESSSRSELPVLAEETIACINRTATYVVREQGVAQGSQAGYLSRFYGYTTIFNKAQRADTFMFTRAGELGREHSKKWYRLAAFHFDNTKAVERIRTIEPARRVLRKPGVDGQPGYLNFEIVARYRIFFIGQSIFFCIFEQPEEDAELYAAAHDVMLRCLGKKDTPEKPVQ